jgi:hypothetical protein
MKRLLYLFALLILICCKSSSANKPIEEAKQIEKLTATAETLERSNCREGESNCATVELLWLEYTTGSSADLVNDAIQNKFRNELKSYANRDSSLRLNDFEALVMSFIMDNSIFQKDFPGSNADWYIIMNCEEVFQESGLLTIQFNFNAYTGGAHGSENTYYLVFDVESGNILSIEDVVADLSQLRAVAEATFRKQQEIDPAVALEDAGYFIENGVFPVEGNFAIINDNLILHYNAYDLAAYSEGKISIKIPLSELRKSAI